MSTEMQTKVQANPARNFMPAQTSLLQRKSALCNTPGLVEDSGRDKEKLTLQRSLVDQAGTTTVPRFGHDFSRLSVHSTGHGMIQAKLKINEPGDIYEQEADRVADAVMRMPEPGVQREVEPEEEEEKEEEPIQAKETSGQTPQLNSILQTQIHSLRGGGQPLSPPLRNFFEPRFGHDFSHVRIYSDEQNAELAGGLSARAFTLGRDIFFGTNEFVPGSTTGMRLLAHELTHVVQQRTDFRTPIVQRAETDTRSRCSGLADGRAVLNTFVNTQLRAAVAALPYPRYTPDMVVREAFRRLGYPTILPHLTIVENWANNNLPQRAAGTKYRGVRRPTSFYYLYLAPAVNLNGNCVGTDKIGHMFQQGYQYYMISSAVSSRYRPAGAGIGGSIGAGLAAMAASRMGDIYARAWGEWSEGVLSPATRGNPALMSWLRRMSRSRRGSLVRTGGFRGMRQGHFGIRTTGVHSRGDLAANESGMEFYKDLLANPFMTFDISRYISADWDEERAGNIYRRDIGSAVRSAGRLNPADVVLP